MNSPNVSPVGRTGTTQVQASGPEATPTFVTAGNGTTAVTTGWTTFSQVLAEQQPETAVTSSAVPFGIAVLDVADASSADNTQTLTPEQAAAAAGKYASGSPQQIALTQPGSYQYIPLTIVDAGGELVGRNAATITLDQARAFWNQWFANPVDLSGVNPNLLPGSLVLSPAELIAAQRLQAAGNTLPKAPYDYNPLGLSVDWGVANLNSSFQNGFATAQPGSNAEHLSTGAIAAVTHAAGVSNGVAVATATTVRKAAPTGTSAKIAALKASIAHQAQLVAAQRAKGNGRTAARDQKVLDRYRRQLAALRVAP